MNFDKYLNKVARPARYTSVEKNPLKLNVSGDPVAVVYNGSYDRSYQSYTFQSLINVFDYQSAFRPHRFFIPDNDLHRLLNQDDTPYWSFESKLPISEFQMIIVLNESYDTLSLYQFLKQYHKTHQIIIIQPSYIKFRYMDIPVICGRDIFKFKALVKICENSESLFNIIQEKADHNYLDLDSLSGFGSVNKFFSSMLNTTIPASQTDYITLASELGLAEIFDSKSNTFDSSIQMNQKRLNKDTGFIPNENEIYLFPLGISNKLRQINQLQKTYYEIMSTIRQSLSAGWRTIHLFFWIGHPLEEKDDWREFKKEIQSIHDYVSSYKKISIVLHFDYFIPMLNSPFLWDELINLDQIETHKKTIDSVLVDKSNFRVIYESYSSYISKLFSIFSNDDEFAQLKSRIDTHKDIHIPDPDLMGIISSIKELSVFSGKSFDQNQFHFYNLNDDILNSKREERKSISKRLTEDIPIESGELDLRTIKKSMLNLNIHLSKTNDNMATTLAAEEMQFGRSTKLRASQQQDVTRRYRIQFTRIGLAKYLSNMDIRNIFLESITIAKIPIKMSKAFLPLPKIAFSIPASIGEESECEFVDIEVTSIKQVEFATLLNPLFPDGIQIVDQKEIDIKADSLAASITQIDYELNFDSEIIFTQEDIDRFMRENHIFLRDSKRGTFEYQINDYLKRINLLSPNQLHIEIVTNDNKILKIEELLSSIMNSKSFEIHQCRVKRLNQWIIVGDNMIHPIQV